LTRNYYGVYLNYTIAGGEKMPDIFKALATITAWALFISGWITALSTIVAGITTGCLFGGSGPPPMVIPVFFLVSLAQGVAAVGVMILRKKMG
jgi:hypothetical protein